MEAIVLHDVGGMGLLTGTDQHGRLWTEFYADSSNGASKPAKCDACGNSILNGWVCLNHESVEVLCFDDIECW